MRSTSTTDFFTLSNNLHQYSFHTHAHIVDQIHILSLRFSRVTISTLALHCLQHDNYDNIMMSFRTRLGVPFVVTSPVVASFNFFRNSFHFVDSINVTFYHFPILNPIRSTTCI